MKVLELKCDSNVVIVLICTFHFYALIMCHVKFTLRLQCYIIMGCGELHSN